MGKKAPPWGTRVSERFGMLGQRRWHRLRDRVRQEPTDVMRQILRTRFATIALLLVLGVAGLLVAVAVVGLFEG